MDLILTDRKYAFKSSSLYKIGVSDHIIILYIQF